MPRDTAPTDATNPVFAYLIIFGTSLIGAAVLYGGLKSTGVFESEGMELGGAAAGFVIILLIAKRIFFSLQRQHLDNSQNNQAREIETLREELEKLRSGEQPELECPKGFELMVSRDFGLGFAKPRTWSQHPEQHIGMYMTPMTEDIIKTGFRGNITITMTLLDQVPGLPDDPDEITNDELKAPLQSAIQLHEGTDVKWHPTYVANRRAMCAEFTIHRAPGPTIVMEGAVVLDAPGRRLFVFALYEALPHSEQSQQLFRQLLSTVKFLS